MKTTPRWYTATLTQAGKEKWKGLGLLFYVRKDGFDEDAFVRVFNGRHYTDRMSKEEARKYLVVGKVCPDQEDTENQYQWYLHY